MGILSSRVGLGLQGRFDGFLDGGPAGHSASPIEAEKTAGHGDREVHPGLPTNKSYAQAPTVDSKKAMRQARSRHVIPMALNSKMSCRIFVFSF
jgi:hypothetical protein